MRNKGSSITLGLASLAVLALPATSISPARAESAESLMARGLELRQAGRDRDALPLFQEAFKVQPGPKTKAQVGLCEYALGLWAEAEAHVQDALTDRKDPWIHKNEATLEKALTGIRSKLGSLDVWGEPAGATVVVDGRQVGVLPLAKPIRVTAGARSLTVSATGFLTDSHLVDVSAGAISREHVALAPSPDLTLRTPPPASKKSLEVETQAPETSDDSPPVYQRWWFWAGIGVVVVAAAGVTYWSLSKNSCDGLMGASCERW